MPLSKITIRPGINTMATPLANQGGWSTSNLVRYRQGFLEKVGGWQRLFSETIAGKARALFAYQDLDDNRNLMIGGDGGLQVYVVPHSGTPSLNTVRLARRTDISLYVGLNTATVSGIAGSATITVLDPGHGAQAGDQVALPITLSVGSRIILPQIVTVISATASTWTFNNGQALLTNANVSGSYGTTPIFTITAAELNTTTCRVTLPAHGLINGDTFQVQYTVIWQDFPGGVSVPAGNYTVASVLDANTFTITVPTSQTALAIGAELGFDATQPAGTIDGAWGLVYYAIHAPLSPNGNWFIDNFGNHIIIGLGDGAIYHFVPPISTSGTPTAAQIISTAPLINAAVLVAMPQAQVIALGSETVIGSGVQDLLQIRWSDAGDHDTWIATATNQAGAFRLSKGSQIIGGIQAPQTTLVWTDTDLWSMTYIGPPLVYSFSIIGSGCGLIASDAKAILGRTTYWMSQKGFWSFGEEGGVHFIECPIWDTIFNDLLPITSLPQHPNIFAGANEAYNEVWWFFPSLESIDGECDKYVKWNPTLGAQGWDYGSLSRTAWLGVNVFGMPLSADENLRIMQHETGMDDDDSAMEGVFAETGFFDISDGDQVPFIREMIPDVKWFGGDGAALTFTLWGQNDSGETPQMYGPYTVTPSTGTLPVRVRKRQIAFRVDWAPVAGFSARLGAIRARIAPAGRRP